MTTRCLEHSYKCSTTTCRILQLVLIIVLTNDNVSVFVLNVHDIYAKTVNKGIEFHWRAGEL